MFAARNYFLKFVFTFFVMSMASIVNAEEVSQPIEGQNFSAQATYLKGDISKPVVVILHGFLTTNKFHTVTTMAEGIHSEGYSVLAPTLTLNINKRNSSIKCGSIHTHTLEHDILEVKDWIDWLYQKGHKNVVLLGHSSGSLELLEYLTVYNDKRVISAIFTSAFYLNGPELGTLQTEIDLAKKLALKTNKPPHKYNFLFCRNNYFSTPESFLSYLKLNREYVLQSLKNLSIPHHTIMGSADKRYKSVGRNWLSNLKQTGTNLVIVEGANHFFSSEHEFDLQDQINIILNNINP